MKAKKEIQKTPFFLIPPVEYSMICILDDYIDVILSQIEEEGGRKNLFSYLTGIRNYKHTQKNVQLRRINRALGDFATYRLIQRDLLLQVIKSNGGECLERK